MTHFSNTEIMVVVTIDILFGSILRQLVSYTVQMIKQTFKDKDVNYPRRK